MRWNCPHCRTGLAISDEKLQIDWTFTRCYQCGGFALIRGSNRNLLKINQPPEGEAVIFAERASQTKASAAMHMAPQPGPRGEIHFQPQVSFAEIPEAAGNARSPEPAPYSPNMRFYSDDQLRPKVKPALRKRQPRTLVSPLETRGQNIHSPVRNPVYQAAPPATLPEPLPEISKHHRYFSYKKKSYQRWGILQPAIALALLVAIVSGLYLYTQGKALWDNARKRLHTSEAEPKATQIVAEPISTTDEVPEMPEIEVPKPQSIGLQISDAISQNASAPQASASAVAVPAVQIKIAKEWANLRAGPGLEYAVVGITKKNRTFEIQGGQGRWLQIGLKSQQNPSAWIRSDLVHFVQKQDTR